jgi:hypothetical protein
MPTFGDGVDTAFNLFWTVFSMLYDLNLPFKTIRKNHDIQSLNNFMMPGRSYILRA